LLILKCQITFSSSCAEEEKKHPYKINSPKHIVVRLIEHPYSPILIIFSVAQQKQNEEEKNKFTKCKTSNFSVNFTSSTGSSSNNKKLKPD
jgi:hypothetical protein